MKMKIFEGFGVCFIIVIILILSLAGLASFALEITKIALFSQTDGELKPNPMDYVYLTVLFLGSGGLYCCHTTSKDGKSESYGACGSVIILVVMILYTIFTSNEMGDIPFFCPEGYSYSSHLIRTSCQVRAANLLIMWIGPAIAVILVIWALLFSCCNCCTACCTVCCTKEV